MEENTNLGYQEQAPFPVQEPAAQPVAQKPKRKMPLILAAAAVVVVVVVLLLISGNNPGNIAEKFVVNVYTDEKAAVSMYAYDYKAYLTDDYDDLDEFFDDATDRYDRKVNSWGSYFKAVDDYYKENLEDDLGKFSVSAEAIKSKDISINTLKDEWSWRISNLEDEGLFNIDDVSDAKVVTVRLTLDGKVDTERMKYDVYLVKMGLSWKVFAIDNID